MIVRPPYHPPQTSSEAANCSFVWLLPAVPPATSITDHAIHCITQTVIALFSCIVYKSDDGRNAAYRMVVSYCSRCKPILSFSRFISAIFRLSRVTVSDVEPDL